MRNVAKVRAEERAAMAAHKAIHNEANHCSSWLKNGLAHGIRQLATPPTLRLAERLKRPSPGPTAINGARHWH